MRDEDDEDDEMEDEEDDLIDYDMSGQHKGAASFFSPGNFMMLPTADMHPEITKLNALNHFLSLDGLP